VSCVALSVGAVENEKLQSLANYGADKILHAADEKLNAFIPEAYASVIASAIKKENAQVVVISNTYSGKSIAPRVAAQLNAGIVSGVISFPETANGFSVRKAVFSGKGFATVQINTAVKVLAITPNSFPLTEQRKEAKMETLTPELNDSMFRTQSIEVSTVKGKVPLTEAELVVSAGRGMKGPEHWNLVEDLADALHAATACSKPVADMNWRPHHEHVGQTGITIKPNLYIAIGISGAIQHLAGISSSKVIVAVNKDKEAPIFKIADYGIVGDAFEVLPRLTEAAKKFATEHH
jgi:electron transfer flavoprotein alpha subunit